MRKVTSLLLLAVFAGCSGRQAEPQGQAPAPRPETMAEATGADDLPQVTLPEAELTEEERAALRVERLVVRVEPASIREGETAALTLGAFDASGEPVRGASGQVFVVGDAAEIADDGNVVVGLRPGESRVTVVVEVPASASGPARTLREEAVLEVLPALITRLELVLPATDMYAGARYVASSEAWSDVGPRPDADVSWSSSDEAVIRIGGSGTMVAVSPGTVRIEGVAEGVTSSAEVRVVANPIRRLRLEPLEAGLRTGDVVHFSARALDANGMEVPYAPVEWSVCADRRHRVRWRRQIDEERSVRCR